MQIERVNPDARSSTDGFSWREPLRYTPIVLRRSELYAGGFEWDTLVQEWAREGPDATADIQVRAGAVLSW